MRTATQKYTEKTKALKEERDSTTKKQNKMLYKSGKRIKYGNLSKKQQKAYNAFDKKYHKLDRQLDKLNNLAAKSKKSKAKPNYAQATKKNISNDSEHNKFAYLRVNNPKSSHSYVYLFITTESPTASSNISSEATEAGVNRMTNTQMQPLSLSIDGTIFNDGDGLRPVKKVVDKVISWTNNGVEMCYSGVQFYRRCVITSFSPSFNTNQDGSTNSCSFSMSIQAAMYFDDDVKQSSKQVKHAGSKGRTKGTEKGQPYVVAKRGDSYARIARSKNVKLSTIKSLNKGNIEAGKKVYY